MSETGEGNPADKSDIYVNLVALMFVVHNEKGKNKKS